MRRSRLWVALATAGLAPGLATLSHAHPMGDTSINHYAGLEISRDGIRVKYLLDFAELPAQRELGRVDPDRDDRVTPEEREAYLAERTAEILAELRLEVNGVRHPLRREWAGVNFPPGQGGLSTVRIAWDLRADPPDSLLPRNFLLWNDSNAAGAPGWKEIRISALGDLGVARTSLGWNPSSGELTEYPEEFLWNPPTDTKAWCHFGPGLAPEDSALASAGPVSDGARGHGGRRWWATGGALLAAVAGWLAIRTLRRR